MATQFGKKKRANIVIHSVEGKDISHLSLYPGECEVLLLPNSAFIVKSNVHNVLEVDQQATLPRFKLTMEDVVVPYAKLKEGNFTQKNLCL